jgi:LPS-assembly lipoprotein
MARFGRFLVVALIFTVSACGYHLRGAYDLPGGMKTILLQGGTPAFRDQLNEVLKTSSGQLAKSPDDADVVLKIYNDRIERRVVSLSERGRSNQFELDGQLEYELRDKNNKVLVERSPIKLRREYFNDQQDIIAKDNEETVIRNEMYQQAVRSILTRSRSALVALPR